jgi:outer membrane protein TolC
MAPSSNLRIGALTAVVFWGWAAGLCGCAVGPDYKRPDAPSSAAFKEQPPPGAWKQAQPADGALRDKWWELFGDAQLDALEERINVSNQTLKSSTGQYLAARDQIRVAHAAYFPTLGVGPSVSRIRLSEN